MNSLEGVPAHDPSRLSRVRDHGLHAGPPPPLGACLARHRFPSSYPLAEAELDALTITVVTLRWITEAEADMLTHCLLEAVGNAIDHGHSYQHDLQVEVTLWDAGEWWHVMVLDQGAGFTRDQIPVGLSTVESRGRGMLIISAWFERLVYWMDGRCAVMSRRRQRST